MGKPNPARRAKAKAKLAAQRARQKAHANVRSPRGLSVSCAHVDRLLEASHTPGFTGAGRGVGRQTTVLSGHASRELSFVDMSARPMFGKPAMRPIERDAGRYTAEASKAFAKDGWNDGNRSDPDPTKVQGPLYRNGQIIRAKRADD